MTIRRIVAAALTALALTACSSTLQDLERVHAVEPDLLQIYYSPDQFPNVLVACPNGAEDWGYIVTTREYQDPIYLDSCPIDGERGDVVSGGGQE